MSRPLQNKCSVLFGCAVCVGVYSIQGYHWQVAEAHPWQGVSATAGAPNTHIILFARVTDESCCCRLSLKKRKSGASLISLQEEIEVIVMNYCTIEIVWLYL